MLAARVLWIDDEIDLLKPHVMFLQARGYEVLTLNNGSEAVEKIRTQPVDIVFLDEQMPGLSGMETLSKIKEAFPTLPVVMVTKSEEEQIMDEAIGAKISDYLLKPVNPGQILLAIKKQLESKRLENEKSTASYQQEFREIGARLSANLTYKEWEEIYRKLTFWDMELSKADDNGMKEILQNQKEEANLLFSKFIEKNYADFLKKGSDNDFEMSHTLLRKRLFPILNNDFPVFFILIDNLRFDHWRVLHQRMQPYLKTISEDTVCFVAPQFGERIPVVEVFLVGFQKALVNPVHISQVENVMTLLRRWEELPLDSLEQIKSRIRQRLNKRLDLFSVLGHMVS